MTDFIDGLEQDLVAAARRRAAHAGRRRRRPPLRTLAIAAALVTVSAGSAAGGTLLALRGSVIPTPSDTPPEQRQQPAAARVEPLRIADPDGARVPPWTLRVAPSATAGLICSTVGQVAPDGRFGLIGLDHRFRPIADGVSDSCGAPRANAASLIGARIFDADRDRDVRTVVSGVAGEHLAHVELAVGGAAKPTTVAHTPDGAFAAVLRGYPEDHGVRVTLTYNNGHREIHAFGRGPAIVAQPNGVGAWRLSLASMGFAVGPGGERKQKQNPLAGAQCASFAPARPSRAGGLSPMACGRLQRAGNGYTGWYFTVRRLAPSTKPRRFDPYAGHWGTTRALTALWGQVGTDVRRVTVQPPGGREQPVAIQRTGGVLAILPAATDPDAVAVHLRLVDGRTLTFHGDTNLVNR
jgi:hypothetical protein